jgi:pyrroloquinoline quinone biosynthesis protein B
MTPAALLAAGLLNAQPAPNCEIEFVILGAGQDAGAPQIANPDDPAWDDPALRLFATSAALIDHREDERYLFEATPFITDQLQLLDEMAPSEAGGLGLSGIFITHAHMGHYGGLMFAGFEAASADDVPVYAMPRLAEYLSTNGPWDQLVRYDNIELQPLSAREPAEVTERISVTPYLVPHRDEYSETVGFVIDTPGHSVLFLPDLDSFEEWESNFGVRVEDMIARVDYAFLDATFYDDSELPGRDMSLIPHPRVAASMDRFDALPEEERSKVRFIHFNHTNPVRFLDSEESRHVEARGYHLARRGDRHCLYSSGD